MANKLIKNEAKLNNFAFFVSIGGMESLEKTLDVTTKPTMEEKIFVLASHLSPFVMVPVIAPLIAYLVKKDESAFIADQAKEALNFQISMLIYAAIASILILILIGFVLLFAISLFAAVCSIIAAIKSADGKLYRYPLTIRFIK